MELLQGQGGALSTLHGQAAVAADQPGNHTEEQCLHLREHQLAEAVSTVGPLMKAPGLTPCRNTEKT
jgi:hypothetical protein